MERTWASLRERIRGETRRSHEAVDAAFHAHDITSLDGYIGFLLAHSCVLHSLSQSGHALYPGRLSGDIEVLLRHVQTDLACLGICPDGEAQPKSRRYDPTALEYVLLGSRLGMSVLRKTWRQSTDPAVLTTGEFLSTPPEPRRWQAFCETLSTIPATGTRADTAVADAQAVFAFYAQSALRETRQSSGEAHAKDVCTAER